MSHIAYIHQDAPVCWPSSPATL